MTHPFARATRLILAYALFSGTAYAAATLAPSFVPNDQPTGWLGEVEVSTFNFGSGNATLFQISFEKANWTGDVLAYPVDKYGSIQTGAEIWGGAAVNLDAQNWDSGRYIVTMKTDGSKIPFRWASLDVSQQSKLGDNTKGPMVLNFIRGDHSNDTPAGQKYRARTSVLGDIIHSRPLFVDDASYPRVYVGSNDGMLHVLDACTGGCSTPGNEVYAYIPSMLIPNLKLLTVTPYVHQYFVDASPNARQVTGGQMTGTQRILVGGLGPGGKGLYGLDITDPNPGSEAAAAAKILWEITPTTINNASNTGYADLGYTYGVPLIVRTNDGNWVAIVGNGYDSNGTDQAVLYVINLATGAKIAGIAASITGADDAHPNGLSSPTAFDVDRDGKVDFVYAGDIAGNLWKFDLRSSSPGSWSAFKLFSTPNANTVTAQSITGAPAVARHPNGGYMVTFGTGRIFTDCTSPTVCDRTDTTQQYAYGLWDNDFPASGTALSKTIDATKLVAQSLSASTAYSGNSITATVRTSAAINAVDYTAGTNQKQGWKLSLASGERVVGDGGLIGDGRFHFAATKPNFDNGTGNAKGENWLIEVDYLTGMAPASPFLDLNADEQIDDADLVASSGQAYALRIPVARRIVSGGVMSQPLLAQLAVQSQTYFNVNPDASLAPPANGCTAGSTNCGVENGHFDFDIYYPFCVPSSGGYKCGHNTHVHQYDDKYNVTGVNMLNASLPAFNLPNAIISTATRFKILMANQKLSPAVQIKVGGAGAAYVPVYNFQTPTATPPPPALSSVNNTFVNSLPTYDRTSLLALVVNMPLDAFVEKDWSGTGDSRVGLVPTQTGCVHSGTGGFTDNTAYGPYGNLWMNGALTIQIIKDTTPDSAIRLESTSGDPSFGYRLKSDTVSQAYQLAEYTIFWHHPNGKCYGAAGWGTTAAIAYPDKAGSATSVAKAPGSSDPTDGSFTGGGSGTGTGTGGGGGSGSGSNSTTTTITLDDGTTVVETITHNADGTITVTMCSTSGCTTFTLRPTTAGKEKDDRPWGRVSWKELIRP